MNPTTQSPETGLQTRHLVWWAALLVVLGALIGAGIVNWLNRPVSDGAASAGAADARNPQSPLRSLSVMGDVADFSLTERDGRTVTRGDLKGHVTVVDFIFTHCAGPCPMMSRRMSELQEQIKGLEGVQLLSVSVDPERDTPEVLQEYAQRYDADANKWWFLTGDRHTIYNLSRKSFKLGVTEVPAGQRETEWNTVMHSTKFVLLDRKVCIRGYYDGDDSESLGALVADVHTLLGE